jgi:hypothetical protein
VQVLWGSPTGLRTLGNLFLEDSFLTGADERFGWVLTAGDFNYDGRDDLAVGRPYADVSGQQDAGAVTVLYMGAGRVVASAVQIHKDLALGGAAIQGNARIFDLFGFALTSGDYNNDGVADLAIGVPYEDLANLTISAAGAVHVIYGSAVAGLTGSGNQLFTQDTSGMLGTAQLSDRFGYSLASGDFDGDGDDDLAVGVPGEGSGGVNPGAVQVLFGTGRGINVLGNRLLDLAGLGFAAGADDDEFGWSVSAGRFAGGCGDDLVIGIPGAAVNGLADAGTVAVHYAAAVANQVWSQVQLAGAPTTGDRFGSTLNRSQDQRPIP